ncbi:MAG: helical backbone metal receptor [Gemmatimonadota bacterium]
MIFTKSLRVISLLVRRSIRYPSPGGRKRAFLALFLLTTLACESRAPATGVIMAVDDAGDTVRLARPASRVVSLVPATTEILFAIGAGPAMVGRTRWCDYPAAAAAVTDVGDGINPNLEAVAAQKPDLVVMYRSGSNAGPADQFRKLGIPTVQLSVDRLADVSRIAAFLGLLTGHQREADSVSRTLEAGLAAVSVAPDSTALRILIVAWDQPPMVIGAGSFLSELVERAGALNVFRDIAAPSAQISLEAVVGRNPDALLVSSDGPPALASRPEWRVIPAVRQQHFIHVQSSAFNRPSPRAPEAIRELAAKFRSLPR